MITIPKKYIDGLQRIHTHKPGSEDSHTQLFSFGDDYYCFGIWQSEDRSQKLYVWMPKHEEHCCSYCNKPSLVAKGTRWRCLKGISYNQNQVRHLFQIPRKMCKLCLRYALCSYGELKQHNLHMTLDAVEHIQYQLNHSEITPTALSRFLSLDHKTVQNVFNWQFQELDEPKSHTNIKYMAIDEVSIGSGQDYMTIFYNLESREVIHCVKTNRQSAVTQGLQDICKANPNIKETLEACAVDMNAGFPAAIKTVFGNKCKIVYDLFHVQKALSDVLREISLCHYRLFHSGSSERKAIRAEIHTLFHFLARKDKRTLSKNQTKKFKDLLDKYPLFRPFQDAMSLINWIWKCKNNEEQQMALEQILERLDIAMLLVEEKGFKKESKTYKKIELFKRLIEDHMNGIIPAVKHKIGTSLLEAINCIVKLFKRMAFGNISINLMNRRLKARFNKNRNIKHTNSKQLIALYPKRRIKQIQSENLLVA